jgi:kinesin family protein 2/24
MLNETDGLYVKAGRDIFDLLKQDENSHLKAFVSFYEIYQGQLYDLLNARQKLHAREDGKQQVCITGLKEIDTSEVEQLMKIFEHGHNARSTGIYLKNLIKRCYRSKCGLVKIACHSANCAETQEGEK